MRASPQAGRHKKSLNRVRKWLYLQRAFVRKQRETEGTTPLTEYLEYFQNWKGCKSMKRKTGDGDRIRDVQLGNMRVVCLSKTSAFNTFTESYGV